MKYRRNKVKREHGIIQDALAWLEELSRHPEVSDIIPGVIEVSRSPERGIVYKYETQTGCKLLLKSNGSIQEAFVVTRNPVWVKNWIETRFPSPAAEEEKGKREEEEKGRREDKGSSPKKVQDHAKELIQKQELKREQGLKRKQELNPKKGHSRKQELNPKKGHSRKQELNPNKVHNRNHEARIAGQLNRRKTNDSSPESRTKEVGSVVRRADESWASAGDLEAMNISEQINPTLARALRSLQKQLKTQQMGKGKGQAGKKKR